MALVSRRRFLEAGGALAALSACRQTTAPKAAPSTWSDAVSQAQAVREGKVQPAALVEAAIKRLESVNGKINAVKFPNFARAREMAASGVKGPLAGVPTLIKDNVHQDGLPYTQGSRALATMIADKTDAYPAAIEAAGLVSIGRSTLPEFGATATTEPLLTGVTRNPWNLDHSTGGSSGGSAAAVAAGVVAVAHANDGGGSIRIPASCCGLVGLKPSRRRMAGDAASPDIATHLGVDGCVSRTVRDTAAWFHATQARGEGAAFPEAALVTGASKDRLRVGLRLEHPSGGLPDEDVQRVFGEASALLQKLGHMVKDVPAPYKGDVVIPAFIALWESGAGQIAAEIAKRAPGVDPATIMEPLTLGMAAQAATYTPEQMQVNFAALDEAMATYRAQFKDIDIYVTPVLGKAPVPIGYIAPTIPWPEQREKLIAYAGYTGVENVTGAPSIGLPIGESKDGLPIGIQFAGAPGDEARLLALAYELERELLWYDRRPGIWAGEI
ncbi:amidase [Sphingosinicella soli]|uniref:Amidase n=1 Tax=Sphingosinicella soli TaxID=333708 RepID=A0A7W7F5W6_9SPHN|nr:amidase [Sphingosinicella soli]MBB4631880.1 amidase [Sphingosinicella soli]